MSGVSFLSAADVADLQAVALDGFATKRAVRGTVPLVLSRLNDATGLPVTLPPQDVVITFGNLQPRDRREPAAAVLATEGVFEREAPFDAQTGDRFRLSNGVSGYVKVPPLDQGAIRRASFTLELAEG